jgi:hypothetical protein
MLRKLLLALSIASVGNYGYSFYTVMADLPFTYQFQNVLQRSCVCFLHFYCLHQKMKKLQGC